MNALAAADDAPLPAVAPSGELARLRREARAAGVAEGHRDGHAQGLAEGRAQGHAQGLAQGHAEGLAAGLAGAGAHAQRWLDLSAGLPAALRRADAEITDALLALALTIARQVVHRTLEAQPEWMLPLVRELLHAEPALQGDPRLLLHPDDVALVRDGLGAELEACGWRLVADEQIGRGGCRVLTTGGEVDATLETRWQCATEALRQGTDTPTGD